MEIEENGFLEYLQLQGSDQLVTKSELIAAVRKAGFSLTSRQLTFYATTAKLIPHSVRVGSRAGAYPLIVVDLAKWILRARKIGVSIEALQELMPVWKCLIRARMAGQLDLCELEFVARQHVRSVEAAINVPRLFIDTLGQLPERAVDIVDKNRNLKRSTHPDTTIGFAIARRPKDENGVEGDPEWFAATRITLALQRNYSTDPATVILGLGPNEKLPPDPEDGSAKRPASTRKKEVTS
ncbi:MerR family transcriptional regulator [Nocardia sp. CA-145437]|uniref:MerR family transcriptional regulator n=1 Tax=Nocardia sp. CA-145437 TaxID=3239980 RepID=UPI003D98486B